MNQRTSLWAYFRPYNHCGGSVWIDHGPEAEGDEGITSSQASLVGFIAEFLLLLLVVVGSFLWGNTIFGHEWPSGSLTKERDRRKKRPNRATELDPDCRHE